MLHWFLDSLGTQIAQEESDVEVVVVDFYAEEPGRLDELLRQASYIPKNLRHVSPKPNVWNGKYRLTKDNWFAAASQRNTALCYCKADFIAVVDDLSVAIPGWMDSIRQAMFRSGITCGAYRKVKNLVVERGLVKSFDAFSDDNRLSHISQDLTFCGGNWFYGCSFAGPTQAFLSVNGFPEDLCDGMGFEDCCMGMVLANAGHQLVYDRRMMTYESEEHHHIPGAQFRKEDWHIVGGKPVKGGNGATDKSHAVLNIAMSSKRFPNSYDIRELRAKVLAGEPFPIQTTPRHEWFTKQPLEEL